MNKIRLSRLLLVLAAIACFANPLRAQTTLLDTRTGATGLHILSNTPRTHMGNAFTNDTLPAGTTHFAINSLTVYLVSAAAASYTNLTYSVQFWNTANGGSNPVFSNAAAPLQTFNLGALTTAANTIYTFTLTLTTPINLVGGAGTNWGFIQAFQGNTGAGLGYTDALTSLITSNSSGTWAVGRNTTGAPPTYGWYFNSDGRTDFNMAPANQGAFATVNAQAVALQIRGAAIPEPSTYALLLIGAAGAFGAWKRRRRA